MNKSFRLPSLRFASSLIVLVALLSATNIRATYGQGTSTKLPAPKNILIPVYFVTDRKHGPQQMEFTDDPDKLTCGLRYVQKEILASEISTTELKRLETTLGWQVKPDNFAVSNAIAQKYTHRIPFGANGQTREAMLDAYNQSTTFPMATLLKRLHTSRQAVDRNAGTTSSEILVYVHGFYNSFDEAVKKGAELGFAFERPVVVYCWRTPKQFLKLPELRIFSKLIGNPERVIPQEILELLNKPFIKTSYDFSFDLTEEEASQFETFLDPLRLEDLSNPNSDVSDKIILVAHSLGTKIVNTYLKGSPNKPSLSEIIYSNSDLSTNAFVLERTKRIRQANKFRVYFNDNDAALALSGSWFVHGNTFRLGGANPLNVRDDLLASGFELIDMSELGFKESDISGHGMPSPLLAQLHFNKHAPYSFRSPTGNPLYQKVDTTPVRIPNSPFHPIKKTVSATTNDWTELGDIIPNKKYDVNVEGTWTNAKDVVGVGPYGRVQDHTQAQIDIFSAWKRRFQPISLKDPVAALLCKVGKDGSFFILHPEKGKTFSTGGRTEKLYAIMNDGRKYLKDKEERDGFEDNDGALTISITESNPLP